MVLEDGVIHHPTRLSEGPAPLTAAIYLNVIGSKLARERGVSKEGTKEGLGSPGEFPRGQSRPPDLAGRRQPPIRGAALSAVLNPTGDSGVEQGQPGELSTALGGRWELGQLQGETSGGRR